MKRCFVFCHGFGFDKNFWNHLSIYFTNERCVYLDLGYFGQENMEIFEEPEMKFIGVGHSLGLIKLLSLKKKFSCLIGLNSFINFLGNEKTLNVQRESELDALRQHFNISPLLTLKSFYKRCGVSLSPEKILHFNKQKALNDLELLAHSFPISTTIPMLIIASKDDLIVPPTIIDDNFSKYSHVRIYRVEKGKHGLGFLEPKAVFEKIIDFLNE